MKWMLLLAIFIFGTFATDKKKRMDLLMNLDQYKKDNFVQLFSESIESYGELNKHFVRDMEQKYYDFLFSRKMQTPKDSVVFKKNWMQTLKNLVINENWTQTINDAAKKGDEKTVQLLLNKFCKEEKVNLIEWLMKRDEKGYTALHWATTQNGGHIRIVQCLLNVFGEEDNDKLIQYVMLESKTCKDTVLHFVSLYQREEIVKLLLSENVFGKDKNKKLIEYVEKENKDKYTALLYASVHGNKTIVELLLNVFKKQNENEKLIQFVMKGDDRNDTPLHYASRNGHEEIVKLLLNVFEIKHANEKLIMYLKHENRSKQTAIRLVEINGYENIVKILSSKLDNAMTLVDLQKVNKIFKKQNADKKNSSLLWYLFDDNCSHPVKEIIMEFLITSYNNEIHIL